MRISRKLLALTLLALLLQAGVPLAAYGPATAQTTAPESMTEGVVQKVDPTAQRIAIKHGEIRNLGMPPMTMVFKVRDPGVLDHVKVGDPVNFVVIMEGQDMVITLLRVAK